jgi:BioD-like phosphotransacetylase family protein
VPKSTKYLLIGSTEAYSGKSATVLGLCHQLQQKGLDIAYGKPLGNCFGSAQAAVVEADVEFVAKIVNLPHSPHTSNPLTSG